MCMCYDCKYISCRCIRKNHYTCDSFYKKGILNMSSRKVYTSKCGNPTSCCSHPSCRPMGSNWGLSIRPEEAHLAREQLTLAELPTKEVAAVNTTTNMNNSLIVYFNFCNVSK